MSVDKPGGADKPEPSSGVGSSSTISKIWDAAKKRLQGNTTSTSDPSESTTLLSNPADERVAGSATKLEGTGDEAAVNSSPIRAEKEGPLTTLRKSVEELRGLLNVMVTYQESRDPNKNKILEGFFHQANAKCNNLEKIVDTVNSDVFKESLSRKEQFERMDLVREYNNQVNYLEVLAISLGLVEKK